jgi:hypothetical protein
MQFKKLAALTGSAIMAGLTLVGPVLAASVSSVGNVQNMVSVTDSTVDFPLFVIGAGAAASDVAGAVDVAVRFAANAKSTSQVSVSGASVGISGGASMATGTNPLVLWDNFASSKQVLTATDLPDILGSGTYVDQGSVSVPYSQYLTFTDGSSNGQIVYDTRTGGTAPELGLKFSGSNAVYTYLLSFTKQISEVATSGTVSNMVNSQISMLGKDWTITGATTGTDSLTLTMLSGKNSQTVTTETPASFDVDGKEYTVKLVAVGLIGASSAATVEVSGGGLSAPQTLQILSGATKTLSDGTMVGISSIFTTTKQGSIDSATVFVGADKLELTDTSVSDTGFYAGVKISGSTINDVTVRMTGTATTAALTLDQIQIKWTPSLEQFVTAGNSIADPASGGFKLFFGGINPAIDDTASRETITVTPSGTAGTLAFKTADGHSLSQNFVRSTSAGPGNVVLQDAGSYPLHIVEGVVAAENSYVVLGQNGLANNSQNPFGHILRILAVETTSTATSQFQDVASGATMTVTGGNTTMYLDGQAYKLCVYNTTHVKMTWGEGSDNCAVGAYDVYPAIMTSKGAWVAITAPVTITGLTNNTAYTLNFPTGTVSVTTGVAGTASDNTTVGTAKFEIVNPSAGTSLTIRATDNQVSETQWTTPGVLVVEGVDQTTARNLIAVRMDADATINRVNIAAAPSFTGTKTQSATVSGTTQNRYMDQYGTYVTYDSTSPGTFSVSYPSTQAQAVVGVGKAPASSGGAVGGSVTTDKVLPITADVVKLDSEVVASDKTGKDLVLMGGSCINSLVADLASAGKFPYGCADWPGRDFGRAQVIEDAFASGKMALVIAGTRAADTDLAARVVQLGFPGATDAQKAGTSVEITGSVSSPAYA